MISKVAVIGTGKMGKGIAQHLVTKGIPTSLIKYIPGDPEPARVAVLAGVRALELKGKLNLLYDIVKERLTVTNSLSKGVHGADLVIEAITEDQGDKRGLYRKLGPLFGRRLSRN